MRLLDYVLLSTFYVVAILTLVASVLGVFISAMLMLQSGYEPYIEAYVITLIVSYIGAKARRLL